MQTSEMNEKRDIEKAVAAYFKTPVKEIYSKRITYPLDGARNILIYLLYKNGMKAYDIAAEFNTTSRMVYYRLGHVSVALKSDTKIREDVEKIKELMTKNK